MLCEHAPRWADVQLDPSAMGSISSQYHRGRNPTRSSPPMTSSTPAASSIMAVMPTWGVNVTRQTSFPVFTGRVLCRNDKNRSPQSRQMSGSHAPGLPRTDRGISTVRNDWVVTRCPDGLRKPTTISYFVNKLLARITEHQISVLAPPEGMTVDKI